MALVWQRNEGARLRGTMSGFFLVGSIMSIIALAATGAVTRHTLVMFAALIPAAVPDRITGTRSSAWAVNFPTYCTVLIETLFRNRRTARCCTASPAWPYARHAPSSRPRRW